MNETGIITIAIGIAVLLITAAVMYTQNLVTKEAEIIEKNGREPLERNESFIEPVRFSVLESIKLGFGFGVGMVLAGMVGVPLLLILFGSAVGAILKAFGII